MGDSERGAAGASRQPIGIDEYTGLAPVYETRRLVLAYGIQFHKDEAAKFEHAKTLQEYLDSTLTLNDDLEKVSDSEYISHVQGVRYTIEETTDKQQFIDWLKTPEVHVIYCGHARYGRGPCFGASGYTATGGNTQTEDWEEGSDDSSGIFRLGYPYIGIEVKEIFDHGYTANLLKESDGRPARADCEAGLRGYLGSLQARDPESIHAGLTDKLHDHQEGDRYWMYHGPDGRSVIHKSGWKDTLSSPSELGAIVDPDDPDSDQMVCRVFAHLGCSTYVHNYPLVRFIANWKHSGNERYAYWTTMESYATLVTHFWIRSVISYNVYNAFQPWEGSLAWAVERTNRLIRAGGDRCRVI